jgi:hypothetical protein
MRVLLWLTAILTCLWAGVWWYASGTALRGVQGWLDANASVVQAQDVSVAGFPNRIDLTLDNLTLQHDQLAWRTPFVQLFAMTWKPWQFIAVLSPGSQLQTATQTITLDGTKMRGSATVAPTPATTPQLVETIAEGHALVLSSTQGWRIDIDTLVGALRVTDAADKNDHRLGLNINKVTFDAATTRMITDAGLQPALDRIFLDAVLTLTGPIDQQTLAAPPNITRVSISELQITWGQSSAKLTGEVTSDSEGLAQGAIKVEVKAWRKLLLLAQATSALSRDQSEILVRGLEELASDDAENLQFTLTFQNGLTYLGAVPLGLAPSLTYRQ